MFTVAQIKEAHSKVKTGSDFPSFIQEIKKLGVTFYTTYVTDSHTDYHGIDNFTVSSSPKYNALTISQHSDIIQFKTDLKSHQLGETDYYKFCIHCAQSGIEKWSVCMEKMTCTYYDKSGTAVLTEFIPS